MPDIDADRAVARKNLEKLSTVLPPDLQIQEEQQLSTFSLLAGTSLSKLYELYLFMDKLYTPLHHITPCKKGCSHCCRMPVSVSALELEYMKNRCRKLASHIGQVSSHTNSPCPFLAKGACSIYQVRPYLCRKHVTMTPSSYWCHPDRNAVKVPQLLFTETFRVYDQILKESGHLGRVFDIREIPGLLSRSA